MSKSKNLAAEALQDAALDRVAIEKLKTSTRRANDTSVQLAKQVAELEKMLEIAVGVNEGRKRPRALKAKERRGVREATAVLLLSDLHPEERVRADTINGLNEFNLQVAEDRMARLWVSLKWQLDLVKERNSRSSSGYHITTLLLPLLGDLITNEIHEEMAGNNELNPVEALLFVENLIEEGIRYLLAETNIEHIHIPCVSGNHDRTTKQVYVSDRERRALTWILYNHLAKLFANEPRVSFDIATGAMLYTEVYGHKIRWTHGDYIKYGGGVGGLAPNLRKAIDSWNASDYAALTCMGHFHTFTDTRDAVVNGSLIGFSPYARDIVKARFEPASQVFFLLDRDEGKRHTAPLIVQDADGWV
jgi:hypothetical protein